MEARRILAAAALAIALWPACSQAADVKGVRSFANQDKTRVVFDLSGKLAWSQSRSGSSLSITIKSPGNLKSAPLAVPAASSS